MDSDLEYIYEHYVESFDDSSDCTNKMTIMQAVLEDAERAREHVLNFKGPRVRNRNNACHPQSLTYSRKHIIQISLHYDK